jgi:hypothetical protein
LQPNSETFHTCFTIQHVPHQQVKGSVGQETLMSDIVLLLCMRNGQKQMLVRTQRDAAVARAITNTYNSRSITGTQLLTHDHSNIAALLTRDHSNIAALLWLQITTATLLRY